jgi:hypothetical protein
MVESRTRGEAYADLKQSVESGWDRQRTFDAPRAELAGFDVTRAGLAEMSPEDADAYVEQHRTERPWLQAAERASPEGRRIIAATDQGGGHGHIRHEGWVTEEANMRRAAYLEDPAQLDQEKRPRGIDGLKPNDKRHICGTLSTRITDPDAFAAAVVRGAGRAEVRAAIGAPYSPAITPRPLEVPIAALLGNDGHKFCTGWELQPAKGGMGTAKSHRRAWQKAREAGLSPDVPKPEVKPVPTFEGGVMIFVIGHNKERDGYEITTMYPQPPARVTSPADH